MAGLATLAYVKIEPVMPSIFLSHSSRDHILAQDLAALLRTSGYPSLFLDFDPDVGIPAGRKWEEELYAALRSCDAVIFLSSNASVASKWCFAELALARSLNRPVIGLVLERDARHPLVKDTQTIDWWERSDDTSHRLLTSLQRVGLAPHDAFDWNVQRPPYPGLDRFESADAGVFFGRDPEIATLLQSLDTTLEIRSRLVVVTGPSGSGKSSLVRAGLVPRLLRKPERWALMGPFVPGQHPMSTLAREVARALTVRNGVAADWRRIERRLRKNPDAFVHAAQDILLHSPGQPDSLLVLIDQFEEVVTRSGQSERQGLLDVIRMGLTAPDSPLWVLTTVRSEFITPLLSTGALAGLHARTMLVSPPDRVTLSQMIELPAARAGLLLDDGLTQRMVHDAGQGDALPLLAYTLRQLYDKAGRDRRLGLSDYEAIGGVEGALQARANQTLDELMQQFERDTVMQALLATVTLSPDHEPMRRRVERSALTDDENRILDVFVGARLYKAGDEAGNPVIEVAHEALIRTWSPLRAAVEEARDGLRLRAELDQAALDWQREGHYISYLWTGERLAAAAHYMKGESSASPLVRAFVTESTGHDQAMAEHRSEMIANQALREVDDPERAILLALAAIEENAWTVPALLALSTTITQSRLRGRVVDDHDVYKVVLSPDGSIMLTLRHEPYRTGLTATHLKSDTELYTFSESTIQDVRFSASGEWIATASEAGTATLWNARTGQRRFSTDRQPGTRMIAEDGTETVIQWMPARSVAVSADGNLLAVSLQGQYLDVWDSDGARRLWSQVLEDGATSVAFSADDRQVLCGGWSGHLSVFDAETGNIISTTRPHDSGIECIATSAMGILTTSDDRTARVEYADGRAVRLLGHTEAVTGGVLSSDANRVITCSRDGTARYWNGITGRQILTLRPHPAEVRNVYFTHDQRSAVTLSGGHTSWWDLASFDELDVLQHEDDVTTLAFSPDGSSLVTGTIGGVVRDWDLKTGTVKREFPRFDQDVDGVAFSVDGSRLITSSGTKAVVWSWPSGRRLRTIRGEYGALSPDGQRIFVISRTGTGMVKDVQTGKTVAKFTNELLDEDDEFEPATGVFSPDGSDIVIAAGDRTAAVWSVSDGEYRFLLDYGMTAPAYSPDGSCLSLANGSDVHLMWNPPEGETVVLSGHKGVSDITFAPDGKLVITSSYDAIARLWDPRTGELIRVIQGHEPESSVNQAAFSPDYTVIATASGDRTVRIWKHMAPGDWLQLAHERVFRSLTADERVRYGLSPPEPRGPAK